ncbi:unnamed protein product [Prorocentrum cordatum]|uniref:Uncharacterized protein n=1 Tax=Prorocentrum cordatum TaxID=2364126 RepID=A0ABN9RV93_9DINO|nr:unnamed protein product [Polarella glacialis]
MWGVREAKALPNVCSYNTETSACDVHSWPRKGSDGTATTRYIVKFGSNDIAPLTADRDLWRPGWQAGGEELAPPLPSAAEVAEGRQWLRSSFGPNSPWARWASRERRRQRFKG